MRLAVVWGVSLVRALDCTVKYLHSHEPEVTEQLLLAGCSCGSRHRKHPSCLLQLPPLESVLKAVSSVMNHSRDQILVHIVKH